MRNVSENSWGHEASQGRDLSFSRAEEIKWNVFEEGNFAWRTTDYSVNSEESGYSSLKDKQVGKKEEEEEEWMLKELVRIAKEEEKAMEMLKTAQEEEEQKL